MRRKIYFFLEQLEINRSERITVTILMSFIIIFSGIYYYNEPAANYDLIHYENLERIFKEKSQQVEEEKQGLLNRYQPLTETELTNDQFGLNENVTNQISNAADSVVVTEPRVKQVVININGATEEQLITLPGIGPAYARRIIEWREKNGLFTEKNQLLEIRGIGERRLEQLLPFIEL